LVNPFLQRDFGIDVMTAGFFTTVWGIGVVAGSLTGGRLTDRIGQRKAVQSALAVSFVSIGALAFTASAALAWVLVFLFGLAYGYYETVYFAISMEKTDPRIAASMFAILMAIANIGTGVGLPMSGFLSDWIGFRWTFGVIALLNLLALPFIPAIFGKEKSVTTKI
jgi:predicted MFS family arabinose efflux permease